jgi:hypothetical protein
MYCMVPATGPQTCTELSLAILLLALVENSIALLGYLLRNEAISSGSEVGNDGNKGSQLILEESWEVDLILEGRREGSFVTWSSLARLSRASTEMHAVVVLHA